MPTPPLRALAFSAYSLLQISNTFFYRWVINHLLHELVLILTVFVVIDVHDTMHPVRIHPFHELLNSYLVLLWLLTIGYEYLRIFLCYKPSTYITILTIQRTSVFLFSLHDVVQCQTTCEGHNEWNSYDILVPWD